MELTYEFLKQNVVKAVFLKDLEMGHVDDYEGDFSASNNVIINNEEEIIIPKGAIVKLNVQSYNMNFEVIFDNGEQFDIYFDDDIELNNYVQFLEVVELNKHFVKEA